MNRKQTAATLAAGKGGQPPGPEQRLKSERVQDELRTMTGWTLRSSGKVLHRRREFFLPADAATYAGCVARLAAGLQQRVQLQYSGKRVVVTLFGPREAGGLTLSALEFARHIG